MNFTGKIKLGRTNIQAGRIGISGNYGVSSAAMEEAFERGCNYFTLGYMLIGRYVDTIKAIKNIIRKGKREELIMAIFSYSHTSLITDIMLSKRLRILGLDHADFLIMGYFNNRPSDRLIQGALRLKEKGLVNNLGLSGHNRKLFPVLAGEDIFDLFHVRYNAANRGAEEDVFPYLARDTRPGIVSFTSTRWGQLLDPRKIPPGMTIPSAVDCYRYVLSHPSVDVCMTGTRNAEQLRENLSILESGPMSEEEMNWMRRVGDHIYGR
jgi:predicted aldo/keto reductase-like oxidoreductase